MKVLVFAAKWIGLHCVEFLLDHYPEDEYLFVVMEPDAETGSRSDGCRLCT